MLFDPSELLKKTYSKPFLTLSFQKNSINHHEGSKLNKVSNSEKKISKLVRKIRKLAKFSF